LVKVDTEGNFIKHLDRRFNAGLEGLQEARKVGGFGTLSEAVSTDDLEAACDYVITTTRFVQLLCEGHNLPFQNLLRCQPMYTGEFNLVKATVEALVLVCESTSVVKVFHGSELAVVSQLLALLIELMQGPCPGNQEEIMESDVFVAINNIIPALNTFDQELSVLDPEHMNIRGKSVILLAACLEGREDFDCHKSMIRKLEVGSLFEYQHLLEEEIRKMRASAFGRLLSTIEEQKVTTLQAALIAVVTIRMELRQEQKVEKLEKASEATMDGDEAVSEIAEEEEKNGVLKEDSSLHLQRKNSQPLVGIVEVEWKGQIEKCVFPLPIELEYLTAATKNIFLDEVDLSTIEKRMSALIGSSDAFIAEMRVIHDKAEQSPLFRALHHHMPTFKNIVYGFVMLLNLNLLFSAKKLGFSPIISATNYLAGDLDLDILEVASLGLTLVLVILVLAGYAVVIGHLGSTDVPMVIRELQVEWAEVEQGDATRNPRPWKTFAGMSSLAFVLLGIHYINHAPVFGWYLAVALLLALVFLGSYRASILLPTSRLQRAYCICYDVVVTRAFLRNHVLLALCSILGLYDMEYFTLLLLDVVNISQVVSDIIQSVTAPGKALFLMLYLFVATTIIFTSFGMSAFPEHLRAPTETSPPESRRLFGESADGEHDYWGEAEYKDEYEHAGAEYDSVRDHNDADEDDEWGDAHGAQNPFQRYLVSRSAGKVYSSTIVNRQTCETFLECTLFMFYQGLSEDGSMKSVLRTNSPGTSTYIARIIFDSVYFVWVGIVLMNIVTGLMVDTFSEIRGDKAERARMLETECFVCGMQRNVYDGLGLKPGSSSFAQHLTEDHDLWTYVYFVAYLKKKDPTEYNGIESYVRGNIDKSSLEWLPKHTSFAIQDQGFLTAIESRADAESVKDQEIAAAPEWKVDSLIAQISTLQQAVASLIEVKDQQHQQKVD